MLVGRTITGLYLALNDLQDPTFLVLLPFELRLDQADDEVVVNKLDALECHALLLILALLEFEDGIRKVLLQLLVAEVDAELLERVDIKDLEAKDVEHRDGVRALGGSLRVNGFDQPIKQLRVPAGDVAQAM